jgi:nuclear pore complex protein Nup107
MIDIPVSPLTTQVILEAYSQVLEVRIYLIFFISTSLLDDIIFAQAAGQRDLIALYAGALEDNAVERYALFLISIEISADIDERRMALMQARDHRLDIDRVIVATAERTI